MVGVDKDTNPQFLNALRALLSAEGVLLADSAADLDRIGRLRYSVYIDELGLSLASSDHRTKQIRDVHDMSGLHLFVALDNHIVGCVRMHIGSIPEPLAAPLEMWRFDAGLIAKAAFISKLIVNPRARHTSVLRRLLRGVYITGDIAGIQAMFCTTFPHLVPMYQRLGLRTYKGVHTDPDFGPHYALVGWMQGERSTLFPSNEGVIKDTNYVCR